MITDHYYGKGFPSYLSSSVSKESLLVLRKACQEARQILPVIIGLEVPVEGQEVLIFGGAAIKEIIKKGRPTREGLIELRRTTGCAAILCHPRDDFSELADAVDGFERYNSGVDFFQQGRDLGQLLGKQAWCNSDAHDVESLDIAYNIIDTKITDEADLVGYIKRGKQHELFVK